MDDCEQEGVNERDGKLLFSGRIDALPEGIPTDIRPMGSVGDKFRLISNNEKD
jgi:hypothetical protein